MLVNAIAIALMFGSLPFTSMQTNSAMGISISTATHSTQNQETNASGAPAKPKQMTVTGQLQRSMAIGGETTGWTIFLDSKIDVEGQSVDSIEVQGSIETLESLADQRVEAIGVIGHKSGVERGSWPVLQMRKIKKAKATSKTTALEGTHWKLIELGGKAVMSEGKKAELALDATQKRVAASAGCNRLAGGYEVGKDSLHFSQMVGTRMACAEPLMQQEQALIEALQSTTGYRISGAKLELLKQQEVVAKLEAQ
jgi:heat shock protein HslJ